MFAASPSFPPLLSLQYRFISMFDNCILCCSSRVPFQLRCPFKPTFRRDRKEVLFPSRDSSPRDIYTFSPLLLLFSFFLYRKEITFRDEFIHESRDIEDIFFPFFFVPSRKRKNEEKPSLKNSENLEIKPYKKKNCIFFITFDDAQTRRRRLGETGRSELLEDSYYTPSGQYNETILVRRAA